MDKVVLMGKIVFDVDNKTKKHNSQSSWKYIAMILFEGDVCEYYSWYIKKRFNITLNRPLRGSHISFINDSFNDISKGSNKNSKQINDTWKKVKKKWNGKKIPVMLYLTPKTDGKYWWLNVHNHYHDNLMCIRKEVGLNKPYFNFHMTIGYANNLNIDHSNYIHDSIKKRIIL
jgi:hypothetical protein